MLGGESAGIGAAVNAQQNINAAGMPKTMPVYFAHDIQPQPQHYDDIDSCLRGAAKVLGADRVGLYGGRNIIDHCRDAGTAKFLCQTHGWSYVNGQLVVSDGIHLLQYDTGTNIIGGANCDLVRIMQDHYGQASDYTGQPQYAKPSPFNPDDVLGPFDHNGTAALGFALQAVVTAKSGVIPKNHTGPKALATGPKIPTGELVTLKGSYLHANRGIVVLPDGSRAYRTSFHLTGSKNGIPLPRKDGAL